MYSDEIFPVGWCNKHKYILTVPKLSYTNSNDYDHCYYGSDIDFDFNESDTENLSKYTNYFKGEIPYHYQEKYVFFISLVTCLLIILIVLLLLLLI